MPSLRTGLYNLRDQADRTDYRLTAFNLLQRTERLVQQGLHPDWAGGLLGAAPEASNEASASSATDTVHVRTSRSIDFRQNSASLWIQACASPEEEANDDAEPLARVKVTRVRQNGPGSAFRCQLAQLPADRRRTLLLVVDHPSSLNQAAIELAQAAARLLSLELDLSDEKVAELLPKGTGIQGRGRSRGRGGSPLDGAGAGENLDQEALSDMFANLGVAPVDAPGEAQDTGIVGEGIQEGSQEELDALMAQMGVRELDADGNAAAPSVVEEASSAAESTDSTESASDEASAEPAAEATPADPESAAEEETSSEPAAVAREAPAEADANVETPVEGDTSAAGSPADGSESDAEEAPETAPKETSDDSAKSS